MFYVPAKYNSIIHELLNYIHFGSMWVAPVVEHARVPALGGPVLSLPKETLMQNAEIFAVDRAVSSIPFARADLSSIFDVADDYNAGAIAMEGAYFVDPVAADEPDDRTVLMTERALLRVAIIAADVGARFASEGIDHDPVAWMLTPREMFGGAKAIDACRSRVGFCRATVLHSLRLGLDADPMALDELLDDDVLDGVLLLDGDGVGLGDGGAAHLAAPCSMEDSTQCAG
jgi:hypothetical protein